MREVRVEQHLRTRIIKMGGICRKWVCPGYRGAPDRIVILPGNRIFFVELKRPKDGRVSTRQKKFHELLRTLGCSVEVLNTKDKVNVWILGLKHNTSGFGNGFLEDIKPHKTYADDVKKFWPELENLPVVKR